MFFRFIIRLLIRRIDETEAALRETNEELEEILPFLGTNPERAERIAGSLDKISAKAENYMLNLDTLLTHPKLRWMFWQNTEAGQDGSHRRMVTDARDRIHGLSVLAAEMAEKARKARKWGKKAGPPRASPWG